MTSINFNFILFGLTKNIILYHFCENIKALENFTEWRRYDAFGKTERCYIFLTFHTKKNSSKYMLRKKLVTLLDFWSCRKRLYNIMTEWLLKFLSLKFLHLFLTLLYSTTSTRIFLLKNIKNIGKRIQHKMLGLGIILYVSFYTSRWWKIRSPHRSYAIFFVKERFSLFSVIFSVTEI